MRHITTLTSLIWQALNEAWATTGLIWILTTALMAGVVRGFAGFGTAMIFLPIAGRFLDPFWAIAALTIMDLFGPLPLVPRAWRDADRPDLGRLILGMIVVLPFSLYLLSLFDPQVFRYTVSGISLGMLVILMLGLRYHGVLRPPLVVGTGALSGLTGGLAGIPGPPVILFYMASSHKPPVIRANSMLFLQVFDFVILTLLTTQQKITLTAMMIGLLLIIPVTLGNMIGARFFNPKKEVVYRRIAFAIVGISALSGLPIFD